MYVAKKIAPVIADVHALNAMLLAALRDAAMRDPATASYVFGVPRPVVDVIAELSTADLYEAAQRMERCVASIRLSPQDLRALAGARVLNAPQPVL
ncbi:MAG TPA: hypothetical protein VNK91_06945 [Burkholderiaceae bacterium]|nr:hypothetical protein [Burkholderiaceae bacterium]